MKLARSGLLAAARLPAGLLLAFLIFSLPFLLVFPVGLTSWNLGFGCGVGAAATVWAVDIRRQHAAQRAKAQFEELLGKAVQTVTFDLMIAAEGSGARCTHVYDPACGLSRGQIAAVLRGAAESLEPEEPSPERMN